MYLTHLVGYKSASIYLPRKKKKVSPSYPSSIYSRLPPYTHPPTSNEQVNQKSTIKISIRDMVLGRDDTKLVPDCSCGGENVSLVCGQGCATMVQWLRKEFEVQLVLNFNGSEKNLKSN